MPAKTRATTKRKIQPVGMRFIRRSKSEVIPLVETRRRASDQRRNPQLHITARPGRGEQRRYDPCRIILPLLHSFELAICR
jgi:hypothetical protein